MIKVGRSLMVFLIFCFGTQTEVSAQTNVDSLFVEITNQFSDTPLKENLKALKKFVREHPNYAPAHHEMAKLYMAQNTPQSRQRAKRALQKTIQLDRKNPIYQITLGDLYWAQGFRSKANTQFEKIYSTYPDNAKAAYEIGHHAIKQYDHYKNMGTAFKYLAQEDLERAIAHLKKSIEINPKYQDPYYLLGILYDNQKQPQELVKLANQLLTHRPNDKDALLFRGLGLQRQRLFDKANTSYQAALDHMDNEERKIMESIDLITDPKQQPTFKTACLNVSQSQDTLAHDTFWREQDPLFLTEFNERRLAHYGRIAYANLHFSQPSKNIAGWQTDMGKTYIRFGEPLRKQTTRPYIKEPPSGAEFMTVYTHQEHWFYEGFKLTFQNWDGLDAWGFAKMDVARISIAGSPNLHPAMRPTTDRLATEVFQETPSRYIDPYRFTKYSMPYQLVSFQEADSIRIELSYVLPKHKLLASAIPDIVNWENGTFLFDHQWQPIYRNVDKKQLDLRKPLNFTSTDSLRKNHLISTQQLKVKPGNYHVIAETWSNKTGAIGTVRTLSQFAFDDSIFSASDLLLANTIQSRTPFPEKRADLLIKPNPMRTYYRHAPIFIYLEVYNLTQNTFGQTQYEITYQLEPPKKKDIDPAFFVAIDFSKKQGSIEIETVNRENAIF